MAVLDDLKVVAAVEVKEPTEAELKAQLQKALDSNDFKQVATVSRKIDQVVTAKEKAEADAKRQAVDAQIESVKVAIMKAVQPLIDSKKLDAADGIWFSYDFGEAAPTVRLSKTTTKARTTSSTGGGGGRKFDIDTKDLVQKYASEQYKDSGLTVAQAAESNTDKNWQYGIRVWLLKKDGHI